MTKFIHIDPATILALPYLKTSFVKHQFIDQFAQLVSQLWRARNSVGLVCCEDHYSELFQQLAGAEYNAGRARNAKQLLIRYLGVRQCARHSYGDSGVEAQIIDSLNDDFFRLDHGDTMVAWTDFLSSDLLVDQGVCAPGYANQRFSLVPTETLNVLVGNQRRCFPFYSRWDALIAHLEIVEPETLADITVDGEPSFVWEKTGHGATNYQERVIVRTARESKVVVRSGTTYQNPQGGIKRPSIVPTDEVSEFRFTVVDGDDVLRGVFKTKAASREQSELALLALRRALEKALVAG